MTEEEDLKGKPLQVENIPRIVGDAPAKDVKQQPRKRCKEELEFQSIDEQVAHYERKVRLCRKGKDKVGEGEALCNLGILYYKISRFSEAKHSHERHLLLAKACEDSRAIRRAYCNLGCTFRRIGDLERATECYEEGLKIAEQLGDTAGEAKLLNNLGNIVEQEGDLDKAVYYHQRRIQIAKALYDLDGESKACASIGNIYHLLGNIRQSIAYYERLVSCLKYKLASDEKKGIKHDDDLEPEASNQEADGANVDTESCKGGDNDGVEPKDKNSEEILPETRVP